VGNGTFAASTSPVTQFVVKVGGNYKNNFSSDLNGGDITSWYSPAAAPNATLTAQVPSCFQGGAPIPNSSFSQHELIARADTGNPGIEINNDIITIVPLKMQLTPQSGIQVPLGQEVTVQMNLSTAQPVAIPVTLEPNHPSVSVNGAPSGTSATTFIPNNNVGTFKIRGTSPGSFIVRVIAKGVQCGGVNGFVN
jgi:hypothetical protein